MELLLFDIWMTPMTAIQIDGQEEIKAKFSPGFAQIVLDELPVVVAPDHDFLGLDVLPLFAQEAMEATRNFRDGIAWDHDEADNSYDGISLRTVDTPYHPVKSADVPPRWQLVAGEETINDFKRKVVFSSVLRDANGTISTSGTNDPETRKVTITVSWTVRGNTYEVVIPLYLANWK